MHANRSTPAAAGAIAWAAIMVVGVGPAQADNHIFLPLSGYWDVPANWNPAQVPAEEDNAWIGAGGANIKTVTYRNNATFIPLLNDIRIDGSETAQVTLSHPQHDLYVRWLYVGYDYRGFYSLTNGYLDVNNKIYLGRHPSSHGSFEMLTSGGTCNSGGTYVGYEGTGEFHHVNGRHEASELIIGFYEDGEYELKGGNLEIYNDMIVGKSAVATFDQTGGALDQTSSGAAGITLGQNSTSSGTWTMSGGSLTGRSLSIASDGNGFFTQTGGAVTIHDDVIVGDVGAHPMQAWYKISETAAPASLDIGGDLRVGETSRAKYEQTGGDVSIGGSLEIWSGGGSYVYFGTDAGTLEAASIINHSGYYDQDGGTVTTSTLTNDSTQGVYLDNNAALRTRSLNHNAGTFWMFRNASIRGPLAFPPSTYWLCVFTNNATFQMGSTAAFGGTFNGELGNYGTFDYYQGDFSNGTLINHGVFNNNASFTCKRLVNYANVSVTAAHPITANTTSSVNAIENHGSLSVGPGGTLTMSGGKPLLNRGALYAGGTLAQVARIEGDVVNEDYMLPSLGSAIGILEIDGDFTASQTAELRIRLGGTQPGVTHDRVAIAGSADLDGEIDVRLVTGFTPRLGDSFTILLFADHVGDFNPVYLPVLPKGLRWCRSFSSGGLTLTVTSPMPIDFDNDCDVDGDDFLVYQSCVSGSNLPYPPDPDCAALDFDEDEDIDQSDFGVFQRCISGDGNPFDPSCLD